MEVFEAVLESCREQKIKIENEDNLNFTISGKSPASMLKNRWSEIILINLTSEKDGTHIFIYDYHPVFLKPDKNIAESLYKSLSKRLIVDSTFNFEIIDERIDTDKIQLQRKQEEEEFGRAILIAANGQYFGGHKAFLAGGYSTKYELGNMQLREKYFIFLKRNKDNIKQIEIIIPLISVQVDRWRIDEESRRQSVSMGTLGTPTSFGAAAYSGGSIHDEGKAHHFVIPYIDENGILQEPRFGISSLGGKAIREWSEKVYAQIVKVKRDTPKPVQEQTKSTEPTNKSEEPLQVLKLRFAKGEISKEEFEEMKKMLE